MESENEAAFLKAYGEVKPYTVMPVERARTLWRLAVYAAKLPGDMAELGVGQGGSTLLISKALEYVSSMAIGKRIVAIDTFDGIENANETIDGHKNRDFALSDAEWKDTFDRLQNGIVEVFTWDFDYATQQYEIHGREYCFVHFDGDTYQSACEFIRFFHPRMVPGGFMLFDDYGWPQCKGVKKAIDEFAWPKCDLVLPLGNYQALVYRGFHAVTCCGD